MHLNFTVEGKLTSHHLEKAAIGDLAKVYDDFPPPVASGKFANSFNLHITRPGCEYDGPVDTTTEGTEAFAKLLPDWLKHAAVSGFGDVRTQETRVDSKVRNACEISADQFSVDQELIERIQATWSTHFVPRKVRAVPYKIHLYGPGGLFKSHRDTPEKDLVGTFLVGIYDNMIQGALRIQDERESSKACDWVAFHPDVPHSISMLPSKKYRAAIAFKIFHDNDNGSDSDSGILSDLQDRCKTILERMQPPYGILMDRQYCMGTSKLSGFDAVLLASTLSREDIRVYTLPVVTEFSSIRYDTEYSSLESSFSTSVYPLTEAHVDYLLGDTKKAGEAMQWLQGVEEVPFYYVALSQTAVTWKKDSEEGAEHTGNESRPGSEDSVYLSYAMLVLPTVTDHNK
jgi:hypothetical protein